MPNTTVKGLKPFLIKYLAMLMGVCYLMNPLQKPISSLVHEISHALESPSQIISHRSISNYEHSSYKHYDAAYSEMRHEHGMVDLIDTIFETSSEKNNREKPFLKDFKIDKHITTNQFQLQEPFEKPIISTFRMLQEKSKCGYFEKLKKPPQDQIG